MNIFTPELANFVADAFDAPDFVRSEEPMIVVVSCFGMYIHASKGKDIVGMTPDEVNDLLMDNLEGFLATAALLQFGDNSSEEGDE